MYGMYANIGGILMVNVTIYSIHGSYGFWNSRRSRLKVDLHSIEVQLVDSRSSLEAEAKKPAGKEGEKADKKDEWKDWREEKEWKEDGWPDHCTTMDYEDMGSDMSVRFDFDHVLLELETNLGSWLSSWFSICTAVL